MSWETSLLVRLEILGHFGNTLTANNMSSRRRRHKFRQQVQMLLSQESKKFSQIFIKILESTQNFAQFERKDQPQELNIFQFIDPEKCSYLRA